MTCAVEEPAAKETQPPDRRWGRSWRWLGISAAAVVIGFLGWETVRVVCGANLHTVIPDQVYRSAQLSHPALRKTVEHYGIRTVINLRGCCPESSWYPAQCAMLDSLGVVRHDIALSAEGLPPLDGFRQLLSALETSARPILIHCRRGADRTGLAAGAALLALSDASLAQARQQLSWRFGHVYLSQSGSLHQVFDMYEAWLRAAGKQHHPEAFHQWVMEAYRPGQCWAAIEPLEVPTVLTYGQPAAARFRVHNRSAFPWHLRQNSNAGVHLQYLLRKTDGSIAFIGGAGFYDDVVPPGASVELTLGLPAVRTPGRYSLLVDMQDEQRGWFFMAGSTPFKIEVDVLDDPTGKHREGLAAQRGPQP